MLKILKNGGIKKKISNLAKNVSSFVLQFDICLRIKKIVVHCMTKYVLSMPIKFKDNSLIYSLVMTTTNFKKVSRKMRLKL